MTDRPTVKSTPVIAAPKPTARIPSGPAKPDPGTRERRTKEATESIETIGVVTGLGAMLFNKPTLQLDSMAVGIHAENVAKGAAEFAEKNTFVAALMDRAVIVTGIAGLATAVLPLTYQIMANHAPRTKTNAQGEQVPNELPPALIQMGVLPPQALLKHYQVTIELRAAQAEAKMAAEIKEAQDEIARLQTQNGNRSAAAS